MESETLNAEIDRLLFRIKAGDADAFCSFVDATKRPLALSALAYLKNADDIEDALQETYISILVHIDGYCSAQNPMGWVYKIFKNKCLSILRNRRSDLPLDFAADIGAAFCFEHTDNMLLVQTLMNNLTQKEIKVVSMKLWLVIRAHRGGTRETRPKTARRGARGKSHRGRAPCHRRTWLRRKVCDAESGTGAA